MKSFVGNGALNLVIKALPSTVEETFVAEFLKSYQDNYTSNLQNKTKPYDGILELLEALSYKGYKLAVVSNKSDSGVKALCNDYFNSYINIAIGESIHTAKKPAKDGVMQALKELESSMDEAIYVGDSEVDVLTAQNSSIPCVGVTWGFRAKEVLEQYGANYIIDEPFELIKILEKN